jgi:hypothetical protein
MATARVLLLGTLKLWNALLLVQSGDKVKAAPGGEFWRIGIVARPERINDLGGGIGAAPANRIDISDSNRELTVGQADPQNGTIRSEAI